MPDSSHGTQVTVIGAGFTGLSAAYELAMRGLKVTVLEAESDIGGLAATFEVSGTRLERFYHFWYTNDHEVMRLIDELGLTSRVQVSPSNTGIFYANSIFRLSTPLDVLRFSPLSVADRFRLGLLAIRARAVKDWTVLEDKTAHDWLRELGGENVYRVVWQPLLKGKFGPYAEKLSAVWFWNKLKLRGGSRGRRGEERLAYFAGGFSALLDEIKTTLQGLGVRIELNAPVSEVIPLEGGWSARIPSGTVTSEHVIATPALPLIADMIRQWADGIYIQRLERIQYLGNVCLILELSRPLSETYWLNVNDPTFPFVGVIEHTNMSRHTSCGGRHIVYLSKYLAHTDRSYSLEARDFLDYAFPFLKVMFPLMERSWIQALHLWRARWSQPIVERNYGRLIPEEDGPYRGLHVCSMAQIYPEDRGTNYAIRAGRRLGARIADQMLERAK